MNNEGSYITPNDGSINDTIKIIEDILRDLGEGNKVTIGIDCNANNFYSDQAMKYEMDNFKTPIENDQLIDYYLKFIVDHPLVTYIEDPMATSDIQGWKKILTKFEERPNCLISMKNNYNENYSQLKKVDNIYINKI
jgi:enolase